MPARQPPKEPTPQPMGTPVPGWVSRPTPVAVDLGGSSVRLVPFDRSHASELYAVCCRPEDASRWAYLPVGPFASAVDLADDLEQSRAQRGLVPFVILDAASGQPVGMSSLLRIDPPNGSVEVGYVMFSPELSGTRGATEAMFLLASHVFDTLGYRRYEWKCDALNAPSRAAALRLGFSFEGVFRQAMVVRGRNRDTAWFAMTDGDWQLLKPAFERWLASTPLVGPQTFSLSAATTEVLRPQ